MEELFATASAGFIIVLLLAIIPYIAIIGIWSETNRTRQHLDEMNAELEDTKKALERLVEIAESKQGYSRNVPTMDSAQGEWLGSEQPRI